MKKAPEFLTDAAKALSDRAASRDAPSGERSMGKAVAAFNAIYDLAMTEEQGWQFMALLKIVRGSQGEYREDDYTDEAAYAALAGEAAARDRTPSVMMSHSIGYQPKVIGNVMTCGDPLCKRCMLRCDDCNEMREPHYMTLHKADKQIRCPACSAKYLQPRTGY